MELRKIESELTDAVSKKNAQETSAEVKKQVTRLLQEAGLKVGELVTCSPNLSPPET